LFAFKQHHISANGCRSAGIPDPLE
jgi:hypothetical protein